MRTVLRKIRNHFFSAFREIFVYHHTSLEFRAKTYAVMIAGAEEPIHRYLDVLEEIAGEIYAESDRAAALVMTVQEYVSASGTKKTRNDQTLIYDIVKELRLMPRYAQKIEPAHLRRLQSCTSEDANKIYQERIIEFLSRKRLDFEEAKR